jgi:circadian clock protein KaiB
MLIFELYLSNADSNASKSVISNVLGFLNKYIKDAKFTLDIIDVSKDISAARKNAVFATPVLIKKSPLPERRIFGTFMNFELVARHLEIP